MYGSSYNSASASSRGSLSDMDVYLRLRYFPGALAIVGLKTDLIRQLDRLKYRRKAATVIA